MENVGGCLVERWAVAVVRHLSAMPTDHKVQTEDDGIHNKREGSREPLPPRLIDGEDDDDD